MDSTPESQAVVLMRALRELYPRTTVGRKRGANVVVVRDAGPKDRGRIHRVAVQFSHGFTVDIRAFGGYYTITLNEKDPEQKAPSWRDKKEEAHPLPEMWEG